MLKAQKNADAQYILASRIEQEYITGKRTALEGEKPSGAFSADTPSHLYQAQMANTVFQADELRQLASLARAEKNMWHEMRTLFRALEDLAKLESNPETSTATIAKTEAQLEHRCQSFTRQYEKSISTRKEIYSQCLAVALMKSQRNNGSQVMASEQKAREYDRMAQTLHNNPDSKAVGRIELQALSLELLAIQYLELGYAFAWSMDSYRAQLDRAIAETKRLLGIEERVQETQQINMPQARKDVPNPSQPQATPPAEEINFEAPKTEGLSIEAPNPYSEANPVPKDTRLPQGVIYSLQLGAYSNPIDPALFRGMAPVRAETLKGGKITKYYAGEFRLKTEADKGKQITNQCGFPKAFVVAWHNGRSISITRAMAMEKAPIKQRMRKQQNDKVQYEVYIGTFPDGMPPYLSQTLELLAPGMKPSRKRTPEGLWEYSIGPFDEKGQAERLRDNLLGSGQVNARVQTLERKLPI